MSQDKLPEPSEIAPGKWGIGDDEIDIRKLIEAAKAMKAALCGVLDGFSLGLEGPATDEIERQTREALKQAEEAGL